MVEAKSESSSSSPPLNSNRLPIIRDPLPPLAKIECGNTKFYYRREWSAKDQMPSADKAAIRSARFSTSPISRLPSSVTHDEIIKERSRAQEHQAKKGWARMRQGINVEHRYLTDKKGKVIDGHRTDCISKRTTQLFWELVQAGCAPSTWKFADADAKYYMYQRLYAEFDELRYCEHDWKAANFLSRKYSNFVGSLRRTGKIALQGGYWVQVPGSKVITRPVCGGVDGECEQRPPDSATRRTAPRVRRKKSTMSPSSRPIPKEQGSAAEDSLEDETTSSPSTTPPSSPVRTKAPIPSLDAYISTHDKHGTAAQVSKTPFPVHEWSSYRPRPLLRESPLAPPPSAEKRMQISRAENNRQFRSGSGKMDSGSDMDGDDSEEEDQLPYESEEGC